MTGGGAPSSAFDVAVVGGGPAGIAAALASARRGARTLLLEREGRLGGNAANALVHTICGLYEPVDRDGPRDAPPRFAHAGLPRQLARALLERGAAGPAERAGRAFYLPIDPAGFARLAAERCAAERALSVCLHGRLEGLRLDAEGARLEAVTPRGPARLRAGIVVDTSGDAVAAAAAGLATVEATRRQRPSYIFALRHVEPAGAAGFERVRTTLSVQRGARDGALPEGCESVTLRPGLSPGEVFVTLTLPERADEGDLADDGAVRRLGGQARAQAEAVVAFLRAERPAFARAEVATWPQRPGVRETRRVVGEATLEAGHVLAGSTHPDAVARSSWPIELWEDHLRARFQHPRAACAIPLGCLVARDQPRLGMAGRCLSASHEALGALRVIGTALATGEAIGVAAALAAAQGATLAGVSAAAVRESLAASADAG